MSLYKVMDDWPPKRIREHAANYKIVMSITIKFDENLAPGQSAVVGTRYLFLCPHLRRVDHVVWITVGACVNEVVVITLRPEGIFTSWF